MQLDRTALEDALADLGRRAHAEGTSIDIAIYGGSALILASNFRQATADVDAVADMFQQSLVDRLAEEIARDRGWPREWLNNGVATYLSPNVDGVTDHHTMFRSYPSEAEPGVRVFVPTAEYMLAMKLNALRVGTVQQAGKDRDDIDHLLTICGIATADAAMAFAAFFYPEYAADSRIYSRHLLRLRAYFADRPLAKRSAIYDPANPPPPALPDT